MYSIYIYILYVFIYLFIAAPDAPMRTTSAITVTTIANTGKSVIQPYIVRLVSQLNYLIIISQIVYS